jgi:hypothetical protein
MKVHELMAILKLQDRDAEVDIVQESDDEHPALKIWAHPETPDNMELNPEILFDGR